MTSTPPDHARTAPAGAPGAADRSRRDPSPARRPRALAAVVVVALLTALVGLATPAQADPDGTDAVPAISDVSPKRGNPDGGTAVTLTGSGFTGATAVRFGSGVGSDALSFTVDSDAQISAVAPPADGGAWVNVFVTTPDGTSVVAPPTTWFQYERRPFVDELVPSVASTAGGQPITIDGGRFVNVTEVRFGAVPAASFTVLDAGTITAVTPPQAAGTVHVQVVSSTHGASLTVGSASQLTYVDAVVPTVTDLSPAGGPDEGGTVVDVTGTGFSGATAVRFGATNPATAFTVLSDTHLRVTAPPAPGPATPISTVNVVVDTPAGSNASTWASWYRYQSIEPTITDVDPPSGPSAGGTTVTLTGTGFRFVTAVQVDGVDVTHTVVDETTIELTTPTPAARGLDPDDAAGTVDVAVTAWGGTASAAFTYVGPTIPAVTSMTPKKGPVSGGTVVEIHGTDLDVATGVRFGPTPAASFTVHSPTHITAVTAPAPSPATKSVYVEAPDGTSEVVWPTTMFRFEGPPVVTSVAPSSGPTAGGTVVTINGSGFLDATSVRFGGVEATSFTVFDQFGITATVPAHAAGTVDVEVTTPFGTNAAGPAATFTYSDATLPHITSLSPRQGPTGGGTVVTIRGSGFTGATGVRFGSSAPAAFTVVDDGTITATSPSSGPGLVNVFVDAPAGSSTASVRSWFTYVFP